MQQRLNNRWLSEQLLESVAAYSLQAETSDTANSGDEHPQRRLQPTPPGHANRRRWQRLATLLLLIGSAAFSYLAWSQSELGVKVGVLSRAAIPFSNTWSASGPQTPPATPDNSAEALRLKQANVHALRVQNRELMQSIARLQQLIVPAGSELPEGS